LPRQCEHVLRHPIEAPRAMQIGHRRQAVHQVNRPAPLEQLVPPRLDGNVLKADGAAQRLRILLRIKMQCSRTADPSGDRSCRGGAADCRAARQSHAQRLPLPPAKSCPLRRVA
jgi:hypothetical protein